MCHTQNCKCNRCKNCSSFCDFCHCNSDNQDNCRLTSSEYLQATLTDDSSILIAPGKIVPFDKVTSQVGNKIVHQFDGSFLLKKAGVYQIHWNIAIDGSDSSPYLLLGIKESEQIIHKVVTPVSLKQASGFALIPVQTATPISLVNAGTDTIRLSPISPSANMIITSLN
ncbi:MAG: hypothetical protein LBU60_06510 [Clostridiales bacterium]|nr:hypothetical protein [Clostridiales bacterium]